MPRKLSWEVCACASPSPTLLAQDWHYLHRLPGSALRCGNLLGTVSAALLLLPELVPDVSSATFFPSPRGITAGGLMEQLPLSQHQVRTSSKQLSSHMALKPPGIPPCQAASHSVTAVGDILAAGSARGASQEGQMCGLRCSHCQSQNTSGHPLLAAGRGS